MSKIYYLIITILPFGLMAQPIIDNTWQPSIGASYALGVLDDAFNFPTGGANQTWDYSTLNLIASTSADFVDATTTPYAGDFPNANIAMNDGVSTAYIYYQTSATEFLDWGLANPGGNSIYSDPLVHLPFPITYGDIVMDTATGTLSPGAGSRTVTTTIEGYGYGDLILPGNTLNNILCVKLVQNSVDDFGGGPLTADIESYLFLSPNEAYTVLWLNEHISQNGTVRYGYVKSAHVGLTDEVNTGDITTTVFPNPIIQGESVNLKIQVKEPKMVDIKIIDITGKVVKNINSKQLSTGENNIRIDSEGLETGIYFIRTSTNDGEYRSTEKMVIK